jgi:hypothetical protein
VTDKVRTTDLKHVSAEVMRLYRSLYNGTPSGALDHAFKDIGRLYSGKHPDYLPCDTEYHDIQHVLDVTLAMARLMDGYERSRKVTRSRVSDTPALPAACFSLGAITALFHDFGYLRRRSDRRHRYGAEYTLTHVTRGSKHLHRYLPRIGLKRYATSGATLVHYTGYERRAETIPLNNTLLRRVGHMLGTADIIAQMADRCYLEKCRDRLYPEFVEGGLAARDESDQRSSVMFRSVGDLMVKTPHFYKTATVRLNDQLGRAHGYVGKHFGGQNLYFDEIEKNMQYASAVAQQGDLSLLRREPPTPSEEAFQIF